MTLHVHPNASSMREQVLLVVCVLTVLLAIDTFVKGFVVSSCIWYLILLEIFQARRYCWFHCRWSILRRCMGNLLGCGDARFCMILLLQMKAPVLIFHRDSL